MQLSYDILDHVKPRDFSKTNFIHSLNKHQLNFVYLGKQEYQTAWELQKKIHELNKNNKISDVVLFLEHDDVYTFGKNADKNFLLSRRPEADVVQTDRGGQVTYHGPGQLVGYPIINLNHYKKSVSWFMRSLEKIIIDSLAQYKIQSLTKNGMPGVWIGDDKICAMGVRISRWVTMHGFALNVDPDMKFFDGMIPCGIMDYGVTSMFEQIDKKIKYEELIKVISNNFNKIFVKYEI